MTTAQITRLRNQMINIRDSTLNDLGYINEEANYRLEDLQNQLDNACRVQVVMRNLTTEQHEEIMQEVEW